MNNDTIPRIKDVLFALAAAGEVKQPLGRLPLQKLIYLADVLAPIWREIANPAGFSPYRNGPYDRRIQNTVDALVFRGIAKVSVPTFRQIKNIECQYSLTESGRELIQELTARADLKDDQDLFREIAREVSRRGWQNIKALVYAEPTYDTARTVGDSGRLRTDNPNLNLSREFLRSFRESLVGAKGEPVTRQNLVQLFFAVLEEHAERKPDAPVEDRT